MAERVGYWGWTMAVINEGVILFFLYHSLFFHSRETMEGMDKRFGLIG